MKILQTFLDPRIGGPQRRALQVASKLRLLDIETEFLIPNGSDSFAKQVKSAGFNIHRINMPRIRGFHSFHENIRFLSTLPFKVINIKNLVNTNDIDIVHVNGPHNFTVALGAYFSKASVLWHLNDCIVPVPVSTIVSILAPRLADKLVVTSQSVADHFNINASLIDRLYPPVSVDEFAKKSEEEFSIYKKFDIEYSDTVIAVIGNINPIKGHHILVNAVDKMRQSNEEITVLVIGKKLDSRRDYYDSLQRDISDSKLENSFEFLGWQSEVANILRSVDLLVMPSLSESGPMVVLEALAAGCPVVTTDVGIVSERFDESCAWIVQPGDSSALATAILNALDSPEERKRRANNGFELVKEHFTLQQVVEQHEKVYRDLG